MNSKSIYRQKDKDEFADLQSSFMKNGIQKDI